MLAEDQRSPTMCSFRFSPVPTPRKNRPGIIVATVAACAMFAGWMRTVGQVAPVPTWSVDVSRAIALSTVQTKGLWPCLSIQGWKWSEISAKLNPVSSARRA